MGGRSGELGTWGSVETSSPTKGSLKNQEATVGDPGRDYATSRSSTSTGPQCLRCFSGFVAFCKTLVRLEIQGRPPGCS